MRIKKGLQTKRIKPSQHVKSQSPSQRKRHPKKHLPLLSLLLLSTTLISPAHGMMEPLFEHDGNFYHSGLGYKILSYANDRSLNTMAQVNKSWQCLAQEGRMQRDYQVPTTEFEALFVEKKRLWSLILDLTDAEPHEDAGEDNGESSSQVIMSMEGMGLPQGAYRISRQKARELFPLMTKENLYSITLMVAIALLSGKDHGEASFVKALLAHGKVLRWVWNLPCIGYLRVCLAE